MRKRPAPNTGDPYNGKTPAQLNYQDCLENHYCVRCRQRWVEANKLMCEKCIGEVLAYRARVKRRKNPLLKDRKNPMSAEVIAVKELRSNSFILQVVTDLGPVLTLHKLESVDWRNATDGKVNLTSFRPMSKSEQTEKIKETARKKMGEPRRKLA